jgi:hypothetical protein
MTEADTLSPLTGAVPQPQECWGLFKPDGKLWKSAANSLGIFTTKAAAREQAEWDDGGYADGKTWKQRGWSIHRVRVEPVGVK